MEKLHNTNEFGFLNILCTLLVRLVDSRCLIHGYAELLKPYIRFVRARVVPSTSQEVIDDFPRNIKKI